MPAKEFRVIDLERLQVKVCTPDGITTAFRSGRQIPLDVIGGGALKIDDIFA